MEDERNNHFEKHKDKWLEETKRQLMYEFSRYYRIINRFKEQFTKQDIKIIKNELILSLTDRVLDLWCGYWRVTNPLLLEGFDVTWVDFTEHLLEEAKREHWFNDKYIEWDFFALPWLFDANSFDKTFSLYSSIWHWSRDDDLNCFSWVNKILKPWWLFLLEYRNFLMSLQYQNLDTSFVIEIDDEFRVIVKIKVNLIAWEILVYEELFDIKNQTTLSKWNFELNLYTHYDLIQIWKRCWFELVKIRWRNSDKEVFWYEPEVMFIFKKIN